MYRFLFLKSVHCHHAVAEATKEKADLAAEAAEAIKATVLLALAVRQAVAQAQAQHAVAKAAAVQPAEGVQDALAVTNLKKKA